MRVKEPSVEEIIRYWGSLQEYKEEQRRTALADWEAKPIYNQGYPTIPASLLKTSGIPWSTNLARMWAKKKQQLKNGKKVWIRPVRPADERLLVKFHEGLSQESVYFRWLSPLPLGIRLERLKAEFNQPHKAGRLELVADYWDRETRTHQIIGTASLIKIDGTNDAEMAIIVSDSCQRQGLGTELVKRVIEIGSLQHFNRIQGSIGLGNFPMLQLCRKLGISFQVSFTEALAKVLIEL